MSWCGCYARLPYSSLSRGTRRSRAGSDLAQTTQSVSSFRLREQHLQKGDVASNIRFTPATTQPAVADLEAHDVPIAARIPCVTPIPQRDDHDQTSRSPHRAILSRNISAFDTSFWCSTTFSDSSPCSFTTFACLCSDTVRPAALALKTSYKR